MHSLFATYKPHLYCWCSLCLWDYRPYLCTATIIVIMSVVCLYAEWFGHTMTTIDLRHVTVISAFSATAEFVV